MESLNASPNEISSGERNHAVRSEIERHKLHDSWSWAENGPALRVPPHRVKASSGTQSIRTPTGDSRCSVFTRRRNANTVRVGTASIPIRDGEYRKRARKRFLDMPVTSRFRQESCADSECKRECRFKSGTGSDPDSSPTSLCRSLVCGNIGGLGTVRIAPCRQSDAPVAWPSGDGSRL